MTAKAKKTVKKVASKLKKASKAHAGQAKALSALKLSKGSSVNKAGNYTKPTMRKKIFNRIKSQASHGTRAGQWSARKAQALAKAYKKAGGGYKS